MLIDIEDSYVNFFEFEFISLVLFSCATVITLIVSGIIEYVFHIYVPLNECKTVTTLVTVSVIPQLCFAVKGIIRKYYVSKVVFPAVFTLVLTPALLYFAFTINIPTWRNLGYMLLLMSCITVPSISASSVDYNYLMDQSIEEG